ncbi:diacylglycerol kinase family protein [uncultured Flavobacterium sp.]|uniref:diacylglycerol kinase family protein n=1 Tax=uncultured Flavobacterium sp. TaxID=165435 RepID=UPI0030CA437C
MKNNILIVINPIFGGIDKSNFIEAVTIFASNKKQNLMQYITSVKNDIQKLKKLYEKYKPEIIIVFGGDGTI